MFTDQELINGEVLASDDNDGMQHLIQTTWNEIARKRTRAIQLIRDKKSQEAIELQGTADEMAKELDKLIKSHMQYEKYLNSIGKGSKSKVVSMSVSPDLKKQKSSNGDIVQTIPKH